MISWTVRGFLREVLDDMQLALIHASASAIRRTERIEGCRHVVACIINDGRPAQQRRFDEIQLFGSYALLT